jgi:hypothetical protein
MIQTDWNNVVNGIVNQYTGHQVAYHGTYLGQCTVPVAYYVESLIGSRAPSMFGDRADGWGVDFPAVFSPFFTHEAYQPGKAYPKGTILMWNSPHIAIVLGSDGGNTVEVFEQNADPDGAPCKSISRMVNNQYHVCTYALVPVIEIPSPAPVLPPPPPYTVEQIDPKQVKTNKSPTYKWGMNYDNLSAMENNPVSTVSEGTIMTVVAIVHHNTGGQYYKTSLADPDGFNIVDCDNYTPDPPPPAPEPAPYVPPTAALPVPTTEQKYLVVKTILYFRAATKAASHQDAVGTVKPGSYYIFKTDPSGMQNITKTKGAPGFWINPEDNVPDVPPPLPVAATPAQVADNTWKSTYSSFSDDRTPLKYTFVKNYTITDLGGQRPPINATIGQDIFIYGTFIKDGVMYYRPKLQADTNFAYYYGIETVEPITGNIIIEPYEDVYDPTTTVASHVATKTVTFEDRVVIAVTKFHQWIDFIPNLIKKL